MMKKMAGIAAIVVLAGCATTGKEKGGGMLSGYTRSRQLTAAVSMLERGEIASARKALAHICNAPAVAGVTDEACFRLAFLSLRPVSEKEGNVPAHHLLRRLKRDFPSSPWTLQAQPLSDLLAGADELRKQHRSLKGQNQALSRENEEIKKNIDQMKHLELELEKKAH